MTSTAPATIHESAHPFGPSEWWMSIAIAAVWGSSFLWIAIAIDHAPVAVVPLARCAFGALALLCLPAARRGIDRADLPRFAFLGLCWMAVPFFLYPLAERTVSTSIAGMINGGLPIVTVAVTAVFTRRRPSAFRIAAVVVGAGGIALISIGSIGDDSGADLGGVVMLLAALVCYAVAVNVARPVQARYGALPVMLWMELIAILWSLPLGIVAIVDGTTDWTALGALFVLGTVGTGLAFALYGVLLHRSGPVRGMIGIFFTPVVGTVLGVTIREDRLHISAVVGMVVVIVGAVMTSRPDVRSVDGR